jgi:hypothetical protein
MIKIENMITMFKKRTNIFVIPAGLEIAPGKYGKFEDYPEAKVFGDSELAEILGVSRMTISRWRKEGLIPYRQSKSYTEFNLLDVINALRAAGYSQDTFGNPTGHNRQD